MLLRVLILTMAIALAVAQIENGTADSRNSFYRYDVVQPIIYGAMQDKSGRNYDSNNNEGMILSFEAFGKPFVAELQVNKDIISDKFVEMRQENGKDVVYRPNIKDLRNCFYEGNMPGLKNSWAVFSTCRGITGALFDGNELYYIEPDRTSTGKAHLVFKASDAKPRKFKCGVKDHEVFRQIENRNQMIQNTLFQSSSDHIEQLYVELLMVNDNGEYNKLNKDFAGLFWRNLDIINMANGYYTSLKVKFSVVGVLAWQDSDKITVTSNNLKNIQDFKAFRQNNLLKTNPNDAAVLFISTQMDGGVLGSAYPGGVCNDDYGASVITDHDVSVSSVSLTFTHELGHLLGMHHDSDVDPCPCSADPGKYCIMHPFAGLENTKWSDCSKKVVEKLHDGTKQCLANKPSQAYN